MTDCDYIVFEAKQSVPNITVNDCTFGDQSQQGIYVNCEFLREVTRVYYEPIEDEL